MEIGSMIDYLSTSPDERCQDFTVNGKCSQCGQCCGNYLPVSEREIKRIKTYIKTHGIKEQKKLFPVMQVMIDLTCPFLDDTKPAEKCSIYPVRPKVCREYRCDKTPMECAEHMDLAEGYEGISMRATFFGEG